MRTGNRSDYVEINNIPVIELYEGELPAKRFYDQIITRFYRSLSLATNMHAKLAILNGDEFNQFIDAGISAFASTAERRMVVQYFSRRNQQAQTDFQKKIHLMRSVQNAQQSLMSAGFFTQQTQCAALMWAPKEEVMLMVRPVFPKIDAARETLVRLAALTIAETCINYVVNLYDSLDGAVDYPDFQKYFVPTLYILTFVLIIGKGLYDYRASQVACSNLETAMNNDETMQTKFDLEITARVIIAADKLMGESLGVQVRPVGLLEV